MDPEDLEGINPGSSFSSFNVLLECRLTQTKQLQKLYFATFPDNVIDIKLKIEECFSIPLCVQELRYQSVLLKDDEALRSYRIRFDDAFHLLYIAPGECKDVKLVVAWLNQLLAVLSTENIVTNPELSEELEVVLQNGADRGYSDDLTDNLFIPWSDGVKYVNMLHFHAVHGLEALLGVHKKLVLAPWSSLSDSLQRMEFVCLCTLANFSLLAHRRLIAQLGGLDQCLASLFRFRTVSGDGEQPCESGLVDVMETALIDVCNISELPEHRLALARKPELLSRACHMSCSPSFSIFSSIATVFLFLSLSHSVETHTHLGTAENIAGLLDSCERWRHNKMSDDPDLMCLQGYTSLILAFLALTSPTVIHPDSITQVTSLMEKMIRLVSPSDIGAYNERNEVMWFTMLPYFRLVYHPMPLLENPAIANDNPEYQLQLTSITVVLFMLRSFLMKPFHRDLVIKEGLVDYLVCLPWHVPHRFDHLRLFERDLDLGGCAMDLVGCAMHLVREFGTHVQLQPPSLCNLAKARLAKMEFGLETVMTVSSVSWFTNAFSFGTHDTDEEWPLH